jgi:predicted RNA binding protein YcfA (HicA-like mRNA interferase family)
VSATGHRRYVHPDGRRTTVPFHAGQDIGRGLLRKILKDIELSPEEFKKLL